MYFLVKLCFPQIARIDADGYIEGKGIKKRREFLDVVCPVTDMPSTGILYKIHRGKRLVL